MYYMSVKYKERNEEGCFNRLDDYKYWVRPTIIDSITDLFYRLSFYIDNYYDIKVEAGNSYTNAICQ